MIGPMAAAERETWHDDVLGAGWQARTLRLRPDEQGDGAVATLVRRAPAEQDGAPPPGAGSGRRAVLYVHGYVDYFFQAHLADAWADMGYDFYAVDLRDHGRSIRDGRLPNYTPRLAAYTEELDHAARILREEDGHDVVVVNGHSTGGLVATLWAHGRRARADRPMDALVLNSPWLDLNRPWFDRVVTTHLVDLVVARVAPTAVVGSLSPAYGEWLAREDGGAWEYDLTWKPHEGFGARAAWLRTIRRSHAAVARGLDIDVPVLVCTSDASGPAKGEHDALDRTDSVLAVEHMWQRAPRLGADVTVVRIPGGVHDLVLSPEPARTAYLDAVREWVQRRVA
jgi:alpha-beta hydrolase superfamily lysophospholipase